MSTNRRSGEPRPSTAVVLDIIDGRPWTARHITNNNLRQHCRLLGRTFRGPYSESNFLRSPCRRLLEAVLAKSGLLVDMHPSEFALIPVLVRIAAYSHRWIRDPESWPGHQPQSARGLIRSLTAHLFALWPVPEFFDSAWLVKGELQYLERDWYCHLAAGGSLQKASGMPPSITARALHLAMSAPAGLGIRQALRWGQVKALGGSYELLAEVLASRMVPDLSNDAIWFRLIEKVIAARDFNPRHFGIIADTLLELLAKGEWRRVELLLNPPLPELLRHCRRYWKRLLNSLPGWKRTDIHCANLRLEIRSQLSARWQPLIGGSPYQSKHREGDRVVEWRIVELVNQFQLTVEGQAMRHCVQSYGHACRAEKCAIFSLRTHEMAASTSHLTIEVNRETRKVVQVRGKWNRTYLPERIPQLREWAAEMEMKI